MKRIFGLMMMAALAVVLAGCGSDEDGLERTYADDDFVLTERNIREKVIGKWEIAEQMVNGKWEAITDSFVLANKYLSMRADGSCILFSLKDAKYRVSNDSVYISVLGLFVENTYGSLWRPITDEFSMSEAKEWLANVSDKDGHAAIEYREADVYLVKNMAANEFQVETTEIPKKRYRLLRR